MKKTKRIFFFKVEQKKLYKLHMLFESFAYNSFMFLLLNVMYFMCVAVWRDYYCFTRMENKTWVWMIYMDKMKCTYFFVGEFFATALLANLMTFIVTAWCTIAAIIFFLTTDAFTASLALLLCLQMEKKREKNTSEMFKLMQSSEKVEKIFFWIET